MSDTNTIHVDNEYDRDIRICKLPSMSVCTFYWKWNTWHGFWQNIKQWFDNRKAAKQRAKLGYCHNDVWDCGHNECVRLAHMLTHFRNKCNSWPDRYFTTLEEWIEYIDEIIDLLEYAETDIDELNDYTEAFDKVCRDESADDSEIFNKYWNETKRIFETQKVARKKALAMFAEYVDEIWW